MEETNFATQDYSLANWLLFNKVEFLGAIEFPGETRKSFVFVSNTLIPKLVEDWRRPQSEAAIICRQFFSAHAEIKKALKESLSVTDV